jgi:hypothetical protein
MRPDERRRVVPSHGPGPPASSFPRARPQRPWGWSIPSRGRCRGLPVQPAATPICSGSRTRATRRTSPPRPSSSCGSARVRVECLRYSLEAPTSNVFLQVDRVGPRGFEPRTCGLRVWCELAGQRAVWPQSCAFASQWYPSFPIISRSFTGIRRDSTLTRVVISVSRSAIGTRWEALPQVSSCWCSPSHETGQVSRWR